MHIHDPKRVPLLQAVRPYGEPPLITDCNLCGNPLLAMQAYGVEPKTGGKFHLLCLLDP